MTCLDFENRLQELCDLRQHQLPDELVAHTAVCPACLDLHVRFQRLHISVANWRTPPLPVGFAEALVLRLRTDQIKSPNDCSFSASHSIFRVQTHPDHRTSSLPGGLALLASALAMLVTLGIGWRVSESVSFARRQTSALIPFASTPVKRLESTSAAEPLGDRQLDVLLHDARDAYAALATQAWQQVSAADVLLPSANMSNPFRVDGATDEVSESLSRPLAPLRRDLQEAVDSWLQQVFSSQDSST